MKSSTFISALLGLGTVLAVGSAHAGGFSRGNADTDILFEQGNFAARVGMTYVNPTRKFSQHADPSLVGKDYTDSYFVPSIAVKANLFDQLACAGTYAQPYGGAVNYEGRSTAGKLTEKFSVEEIALTCSVKFQAGPGNFHVLGGAFAERFNYGRTQLVDLGLFNPLLAGTLVGGNLNLSGTDYGYRLGVAYEIPEIAFRTQLMYRAGSSYGASGNFTVDVPAGLGGPQTFAATGAGTLPQSVELKLQSGIAPGWLALGSVKWTDWSVQRALTVTTPATGPVPDIYNWKDGWTVTGGVGHAFNDNVSGLFAVTWDQGVSTGFDLSSDTWTFALGGSYNDGTGGTLTGGLGLTYLTSAEVTRGVDTGNAVNSGWAYALNLGYKRAF